MPNNHNSNIELMQFAINLNNEGVAHLMEGNDQTGEESLKRSLRTMQQLLVPSMRQVQSFSKSSSSSHTLSPSELKEISSHSTAHDPQLEETAVEESPDCLHSIHPLPFQFQMTGNFMYKKALKLRTNSIISTNYESVDDMVRIHSATVVFNLALAFQARAARLNSHDRILRTAYRQKALLLYDNVCKLVADNCLNNRTALLLQLAATNNLSLIRFIQTEYEQVQQGMQLVVNLLQFFIAEGTIGKTFLNNQDINGFLLNAMLMNPPNVAPAA